MRQQQGFSLAETLVAMFIVSLAMMAAAIFVSSSFHGVKHNSDKDFAVQKAISILDEMKAVGESALGAGASVLDDYDDGITTETVLTIDDAVTDPADPRSSNRQSGGRWQYERQISVRKFASLESNDVRLVNVRVFGWRDGNRSLLAEVSGVIRTIADKYPPTHVYDVYLLAMENVPGWWVYMANLIPFVENAIEDLEARNPGLEFRTHWIRRMSYGRDLEYVPYLNDTNPSTSAIDWVYFYPALLPAGSAVRDYYVPGQFGARVSIDGTLTNDYDAATLPVPYALADQYNHAMRYPDEQALFAARRAAGLETDDTPTYRMLLEEMFADPDRFENAIIINLHGELFPFPPIRNYSDPAKTPETRPGVRVVTHPEQLRYDNSDDVVLRVYSYLTDPDDPAAPERLADPISVLIRGLPGLAGVRVQGLEGGLDLSPADTVLDGYVWEEGDTATSHPGDMRYSIQTVPEGTLIRLYESPLVTPCVGLVCGSGGLTDEKRLYGLQYIPTPLDAGTGPFTRDLTISGDMTKNTARWRIIIPDAALLDDARITVETRIGNDLTTGTLHPVRNEPTNASRTYVWRGSDLWAFGDGTSANPPSLPLTERYQIQGDPRHNPYADLHAAWSVGNPLGTGYNRYFDDFHDASGNQAAVFDYWPGFSGVKDDAVASNDGWDTGGDFLEIDVNRAFQTLRSSLLRSRTVYTTLTGFSYFYIGLGNEIGYDSANGFPNSINVSSKPFDGTAGTRFEMSITDAQSGGVKYVRENDGPGSWWSMNWLGELWPDDAYATWRTSGNLRSGSGASRFVRELRENITDRLPTGTTFNKALRRTKEPGSTTFFSIGTTASKFHHQYENGGSGTLQTEGLEIKNGFNYPIPSSVDINRPFNLALNADGTVPDHYKEATYDTASLTASSIATYFDHTIGTVIGSSLVRLEGDGSDASWITMNGISNTQLTGSAFIGRWSFLTLIQSFINAGKAATDPRIPQLPRVEIVSPDDLTDLDDPSSIDVQWLVEWKRWDGQKYTPSYADGFSESTPLDHVLMYSDDGGRSWKHVQDGSAATPGVRPVAAYRMTPTSFTWSTPAGSFPRGSYLIRVESYRQDIALHHSYHQQKVYIKR
ncbi:MAG: type II secretion system GspH family protein [Acidobacteriota bacterium]|nr:type II secretion system GspH family protein [Acidobacteriota bacterium]